MLRLCCYVKFGGLKPLTYLASFEAELGWDTLTNTAAIKLPRQLGLRDRAVRDYFKAGQSVEVWLGYDNQLKPVFAGYVSKVCPTDGGSEPTLKLELEDEMWQLKQQSATWSWPSVKLSTVLAAIAPGYKVDAPEADMGLLTLPRKTPAAALDFIKERYHLAAYFAAPTAAAAAGANATNLPKLDPPLLRVGYVYTDHLPTADAPTPVAVLSGPASNVAQNKLEYARADEVKLKVKAINNLPDNGTQEHTIGPPDGAERTLNFYNEPDFRAKAEAQYKQLNFEGYRGSIVMFGAPQVRPCDRVRVRDPRNPDREGLYFANKVKISFSPTGGYRQEVELGRKLG